MQTLLITLLELFGVNGILYYCYIYVSNFAEKMSMAAVIPNLPNLMFSAQTSVTVKATTMCDIHNIISGSHQARIL